MTRYGVIEHIHTTDQFSNRHDWIGAPCEIVGTKDNHILSPNYTAAVLRIINPDRKEDERFFYAVKIREVDFLEVCRLLVINSKGE